MRRALLLLCLLVACRTPADWGAPEPMALEVERTSLAPVGGGVISDARTVDALLFDAASDALARRGIAVDPQAQRTLHLELTTLDDASLVTSRVVRVGLRARLTRPGAPAREWTWGPKNVRVDLPAANRSLQPYLAEAVRRLVAEGPR